MTEHAVVIAGGGPTGLMLAGELALAGVDVVIVERRTSQDLDGSRARGLLPRTIEVLDQRGIAERFVSAGQVYPAHGFALIPLDISDFPTRHNYVLGLLQSHFERILAGWVGELAVPILRGRDVVGFAQDDTGVDVELSGDTSLRAEYLVGCDGGRSLVRKAAGIDFPGLDPSTSWMIAEVEMDEEPEFGFRRDSAGTHALGRADGGLVGVVLTEREVAHTGEPSMDELREALVAVSGTDYGLRSANWISRFTDMTRQAASYRRGRVLLAGDAAHIHPPHGGQGMGTGVQDAVNLGWKLAQVVNKTSPESLLDTYHAERHPVGARVLHNTMAQVALSSPDDRHQALRDIMTELLSMDEPRRRIAAMLCGLDIHYDLGEGHPLLGRRMPDLDVQTADGPTRVFTLLHDARPVLLNLGKPGGFDISPWSDRVRMVDAKHDGVWELPVLGEVAAPPAVLIRPDGHVAWAGDLTDPELPQALATWFGAATPTHANRRSALFRLRRARPSAGGEFSTRRPSNLYRRGSEGRSGYLTFKDKETTVSELLVDFITSLDGYASAEGWPGWWGLEGPEYLAWLGEQPEVTYLMGANTYRLMSGFAAGETPAGTDDFTADEEASIDALTRASKVVFSTSLEEPLTWANATLVRDDAVEVVRAMKEGGSGLLSTIGSISLCRSLLRAGLVDRFRVVMFPVITGATGAERIYDGYPDVALEMIDNRTFDGRIHLVEYRPRVLEHPPLDPTA